ncbi:MAG TPA: hypothetical protein VKU37_03535 [Verrucomicrobiae bacterium]|nr:hypothetical protein [Verrucomicrobiae bacterium]
MKSFCLKYLLPTWLFAMAGTTQAQLVNGNFETGDLTGWTLFNTVGSNTPYGVEQGGTAVARAVQFDTANTGVPSYSAEFEVGETAGIVRGGLGQGAGIYQYVPLDAGQLDISVDIAVTSSGDNADAGTFELLLDGTLVASDAFGGISVSQILHSTLSYSGTVAAGTHQIAIDMRRGYGMGYGNTPCQFLDNVVLTGTAVPEPATALFPGLAALAVGIRRKLANGQPPARSFINFHKGWN